MSKASPIKKASQYSDNKGSSNANVGAGSSSVNLEKAYEELERDILEIKKKLQNSISQGESSQEGGGYGTH